MFARLRAAAVSIGPAAHGHQTFRAPIMPPYIRLHAPAPPSPTSGEIPSAGCCSDSSRVHLTVSPASLSLQCGAGQSVWRSCVIIRIAVCFELSAKRDSAAFTRPHVGQARKAISPAGCGFTLRPRTNLIVHGPTTMPDNAAANRNPPSKYTSSSIAGNIVSTPHSKSCVSPNLASTELADRVHCCDRTNTMKYAANALAAPLKAGAPKMSAVGMLRARGMPSQSNVM